MIATVCRSVSSNPLVIPNNEEYSSMNTKKPMPLPILLVMILFSLVYLVNPTAGLIEFIPDNAPFIGNLDEAGATAMLIWAISELRNRRGVDAVPPKPKDVTPPYQQ